MRLIQLIPVTAIKWLFSLKRYLRVAMASVEVTWTNWRCTIKTRESCLAVWWRLQPQNEVNIFGLWNIWYKSVVLSLIWLWFVDTVLWLCPSLPTETLKWLSSLPILMQESCWWWQCSNRYITSLFPYLKTPLPAFSPSLINLLTSVDVKHHVYLLTYASKWHKRTKIGIDYVTLNWWRMKCRHPICKRLP